MGDCFEVRAPLLYIPAFNTMKDFRYKWSHRITRCRNTYKVFTLELLDSLVPSFVPARTNNASTLACRGRTSTPSSHKNSKQHEPASSPPQMQRMNTWWSKHFDHLKALSQQLSYRIDIAMNSSSVCVRKLGLIWWWKTQEITFENSW